MELSTSLYSVFSDTWSVLQYLYFIIFLLVFLLFEKNTLIFSYLSPVEKRSTKNEIAQKKLNYVGVCQIFYDF